MSVLRIMQKWGFLRYPSTRHAIVCGSIAVLLALYIDLVPFKNLSVLARFVAVPACLIYLWLLPPSRSIFSRSLYCGWGLALALCVWFCAEVLQKWENTRGEIEAAVLCNEARTRCVRISERWGEHYSVFVDSRGQLHVSRKEFYVLTALRWWLYHRHEAQPTS
jgi:hypothetical protein